MRRLSWVIAGEAGGLLCTGPSGDRVRGATLALRNIGKRDLIGFDLTGMCVEETGAADGVGSCSVAGSGTVDGDGSGTMVCALRITA